MKGMRRVTGVKMDHGGGEEVTMDTLNSKRGTGTESAGAAKVTTMRWDEERDV